MRIAYLTGQYPRATDTFIQREVAALREDGVEVVTFSVRKPADHEQAGTAQQAETDATRYLLPTSPATLISALVWGLFKRPGRFFGGVALAWKTRGPGLKATLYQAFYFIEAVMLARMLYNDRVEHLHNHFANSSCSVAMLASAISGVPFSFTIHGPAIFFEPMRWRIDEKARRAKFVSCISHFCRSQVMLFAPRQAWDRLHIVHCGVEPAKFQPRRHAGDAKRLLFVGRLAAVKGLNLLLDAFMEIAQRRPGCELTLVGDGPERAEIKQRVREMGLESQVTFTGYQSPEKVGEYLAKTDVFVLPSFAEGVPVVLMEAMAAGVPVVATRVAGVTELVDHETSGLVVPPGDCKSLSEAIDRLLDDGAMRQRMAEAGRARVEAEFDIRIEARRLRNLIENAGGRSAAAVPALHENVTPTTVGGTTI